MSDPANWPSTHLTLLNRLRDPNDSGGWEAFWESYSPFVYRFCLRHKMQHEDALDVCQNAMLSMQRSLTNFDPVKGRFRGWFCQILRREVIKYKRKKLSAGIGIGGEANGESNWRASDNEKQMAAEDEREFKAYIVELAITRIKPELSPIEQTIMEQVVIRGRKPRFVAAEMQVEPAWISRLKFRLVQRLKLIVGFLDNGGSEAD